MNLRQLEYFKAIAEERQITAAARRLHITQPPLSYELASLERELGTKLVERSSRGTELTEAGRVLYQRACQMLDLAEATKREVGNVGRGLAGTPFALRAGDTARQIVWSERDSSATSRRAFRGS